MHCFRLTCSHHRSSTIAGTVNPLLSGIRRLFLPTGSMASICFQVTNGPIIFPMPWFHCICGLSSTAAKSQKPCVSALVRTSGIVPYISPVHSHWFLHNTILPANWLLNAFPRSRLLPFRPYTLQGAYLFFRPRSLIDRRHPTNESELTNFSRATSWSRHTPP